MHSGVFDARWSEFVHDFCFVIMVSVNREEDDAFSVLSTITVLRRTVQGVTNLNEVTSHPGDVGMEGQGVAVFVFSVKLGGFIDLQGFAVEVGGKCGEHIIIVAEPVDYGVGNGLTEECAVGGDATVCGVVFVQHAFAGVRAFGVDIYCVITSVYGGEGVMGRKVEHYCTMDDGVCRAIYLQFGNPASAYMTVEFLDEKGDEAVVHSEDEGVGEPFVPVRIAHHTGMKFAQWLAEYVVGAVDEGEVPGVVQEVCFEFRQWVRFVQYAVSEEGYEAFCAFKEGGFVVAVVFHKGCGTMDVLNPTEWGEFAFKEKNYVVVFGHTVE